MTRYLLVFAGLAASAAFFVSAAHAAPELPGFYWPGGARQDSTFNAPGTSINGMRIDAFGALIDKINSDLAAAEILAQAAIPKAQIDVAGGVAGLDAAGSMTANIATSLLGLNYAGLPFSQAFGAFTDPWTPPWMMRFGGLVTGRPVSQQLYGLPDGPNDSGAVLSVGATDAPFTSLRPGIGPDALSNTDPSAIANYGALDGAVLTNQIDTPVPLVRVGADIKDWDGNTHTVTFGCDSTPSRICFSPALPAAWVAMLHRGENVLTNVIGPGPQASTGNGYQMPNVLASQINAVDPAGAYVDTVGWAVPGSGISNGFVPMTSSYAGDSTHPAVTAGTLDAKWSQYSHPAVFFGAVTSMFSNYGYCRMNHAGQHDPARNINASDSMMHACTIQQFDVFNADPDYTNSFGGWGIAYQGPNKPTSDSQMVWLSGAVPTYNRYRYVDPGTRLFDTTAGFNVDYPLPLPTDGTTNWQSQRFMQGNEVVINGIALKLQSWGQVDTALPENTTETQSVATSSVHLGVNYGSGPNTDGVDGNNIGQVIFNATCGGATGGVALGTGGTGPSSPLVGACVDTTGYLHALNGMESTNDLTVDNGHGMVLKPTDTSAGWSYLYGKSGTEIDIGNSGNSAVTVNLGSGTFSAASFVGDTFEGATGTFSSALTILGGKSLFFTPEDASLGQPTLHADTGSDLYVGSTTNGGLGGLTAAELSSKGSVDIGSYTLSGLPTWVKQDAIASCSDCKLNGTSGVLAYWHYSAQKWTDSQNNTLTN